jgi:hypothetical protein
MQIIIYCVNFVHVRLQFGVCFWLEGVGAIFAHVLFLV